VTAPSERELPDPPADQPLETEPAPQAPEAAAEPASEEALPASPGPLPSVSTIVRLAVDALEEAGPELRILSAAVVLFGAAAVGIPLGSIFLYGLASSGGGENAVASPAGPAIATLLAGLVGAVALIVLLVQIPLLVIATVGARLAGQPLTLREALRRSRQVFPRGLGGVIAIALLTGIPTTLARSVLVAALGRTQLASGLLLLAGATFASPWVYVLPGIVLGGVGVSEALRRSWGIARLRWRLAVTVALLGVVGQFVVLSAASAITGAVETIVFVAGTRGDLAASLGPVARVAFLVASLIVTASLVFGVQLVQFAPQASGFYAMTGFTAGLDPARGGAREPLFQRRALIFYAVGILAGLYLLASAFELSGR
jgi:hypothetical protein